MTGWKRKNYLPAEKIHVAPVAAEAVTAGAAAWGGRVTARQVSEQMGLLGNTNVLDRTPGGIVVLAVNPGGHTCPYGRGGRFNTDCRQAPRTTVHTPFTRTV